MIRQAHLQLIAGHSVKHGIRSGSGLVAIFMTLVTGLILASVVISPLEAFQAEQNRFEQQMSQLSDAQRTEIQDEINGKVKKIASKAINWAIDPSEEQLKFLSEDHPVVISAFLVLLVLFTPFLVALAGSNQTSNDIDSKGLRFLLIRTERPNIFLGRFIGTYLFTAVVFALLFAILGVYMAAKIHLHSPGEMITWLALGYLRIMLFALPYMALCAWVSCMIESAFGSLMIALMIIYFYPALIALGKGINSAVGYLQYATPWGWKWMLLAPVGGSFFLGIGVMLAFTAALLFLGNRYFAKRDL